MAHTSRAMASLILTQDQWNLMRSHVEAVSPEEACGLLAGNSEVVREVLQIPNQLRSRTAFRMDPVEQLRAFNRFEANGLDLIGIYHSHPAGAESGSPGRPDPSPTDILESAYPVVQVIWSRPDGTWRARGFLIDDGRASEVELQIGNRQ